MTIANAKDGARTRKAGLEDRNDANFHHFREEVRVRVEPTSSRYRPEIFPVKLPDHMTPTGLEPVS
jgi:hypothetical protein